MASSSEKVPSHLILRCIIAGVGGYGYAILSALMIAYLRDTAKAEAVVSGVLLGFIIHALIIIGTFATKSLTAWVSFLSSTGILMIAFIIVRRGLADV
jgi:hypothetical protein